MLALCVPASSYAQSVIQAGMIVAISGNAEFMRNRTRIEASSGTSIIAGDSIITGTDSWIQIALRDHALFSLAANSQFSIDEFAQNNSPDSSRLITSLVSGVVKFISGKIASQNQQAMQVKFGTVTAAIRGTSGVISTLPTGQSQLTLLSGKIELLDSTNQKISQLVRSGWGVDISASGTSSALTERSTDELSSWLAQTASTAQTKPPEHSANNSGNNDAIIEAANGDSAPKNLAYLLSTASPNQRKLFSQLEDAKKYDDGNKQITIDTNLLDYALSGGQPLWMRYFKEGYFGNPPHSDDKLDYDIYNAYYRGLVSTHYSGEVHFAHEGFELVPVADIEGRGIAGFTATLDYDKAELAGQFWLKEVEIDGIEFADSLPQQLGFSALPIDGLIVDIPIGSAQLTAINPQAGITSATADMTTSIGSITDGTSVLDGKLGIFAVTLTPETGTSPVLAGQAIISGQ